MLTFSLRVCMLCIRTRKENVNMRTTTTVHWNTGEVSEKHNQRDEQLCKHESHIDLYGERDESSHHEVLVRNDLRDVYEDVFGEALAEYNAKQTRKDRQMDMDQYMQSIKDDTRGKRQTKKVNGKSVVNEDAKRQGKQLSYEVTIKVGNTYRRKDEHGRTMYDENGHHIRDEELPCIISGFSESEYAKTFQERNPNFRVVNIDLHDDEGFYNAKGVWEKSIPHLHIEFVPVAHGFKQGMSVQNSMNKAMKEMGFEGSDCYSAWAKREQEFLNECVYKNYDRFRNHFKVSDAEVYPAIDEAHAFAISHGDLEIYNPVSSGSTKGGKSKEQIAQEQELDEAIHEANHIKNEYMNKRSECNATLVALNAQKSNLNEQERELQDEMQKLKFERSALSDERKNLEASYNRKDNEMRKDFQKKQDALEAQQLVFKEAANAYKKATVHNVSHQSTPFEQWAKQKVYETPARTLDERGNPVYKRDERGQIIMRKSNPLQDYQSEQKRMKGYEFSSHEMQVIHDAEKHTAGRGDEFNF